MSNDVSSRRLSLIANWRQSWRMASVQIAGLAVIFGALPADQQTAILAWLGIGAERIPAVVGALVIFTRLIDQPKTRD